MKRKIEKIILLVFLIVVGAYFAAPDMLNYFNWQEIATSVSQISELPQEILEQIEDTPVPESTSTTVGSAEAQLGSFDIPTYNSGVLMEAYSVEDSGAGVQFCVYCFNVQPGVSIDYRTGENHEDLTYFLPEKAGQ